MTKFYDKKHFFEYVFPIENLELTDKRSYKIGNVNLINYNDYQYNKSINKIKKILDKNRYYKDRNKAKKNVISHAEKIYEKNIGKVCAIIEEYGYIEDAYFKALSDVKTSINVLKLYRNPGVQDDNFLGRFFGIQGEVLTRGVRSVFIKAQKTENYRPTAEVYGSMRNYKIDNMRVNFMKNNGFDKIHLLLKKKRFNALDKRIISAINWFGKSYNSNIAVRENYRAIRKGKKIGTGSLKIHGISEPERLLYCIIALEGLLLFGNKENKEKSVTERVMKILDGYLRPIFVNNVPNQYHQFYKIRCDIVHGGRYYISKKELNSIFSLTQDTIFALIKKRDRYKMDNVPDFQNWLKK